jgi:uncharacterized cupin superfamily protein
MHAFKLDQPVPELQPIGSVSLLGATPTAGDPQVAGAMVYGEPQDAFTCGLFSSTEGVYHDLSVYRTRHRAGRRSGADRRRRQAAALCPGDSWFVKQGTEVEWKILTPRFVKHYLANVESR